MCLLFYFLWSVILLSNEGQCDLTVGAVYGLLSAQLDKIILEQDDMKKEIKDLVSSTTAANQQLSEVASLSQQMVVFQERLDKMDSHVKDVATAEVGRRTHLLRRGLEQEKTATQSRFEKTEVQIFKIGQESVNNISDLSARVEILDNKHDIIKHEVDVLASTIHQKFNETAMQISKLEQDMVVTLYNATSLCFEMFDSLKKTQSEIQSEVDVLEGSIQNEFNETGMQIFKLEQNMVVTLYNASSLFEMFDSLKKTQSDIKSEMKHAFEKNRAQIATVQQEVSTTQRNAQSLQSRDDNFERTLSDLKSKTSTIAAQMDTTRGQISRLQHVTGTFVGFSTELSTWNSYYNKGTVIKFDHVYYNEGGHYSTSTGIFTVPVSGVYVFMFNVQVRSDSSDKNRFAHVVLCVNGVDKMEAIVKGIDFNLTGGNAAVVKVSAGDRVYVSTAKFQDRNYIWPGSTSFSGALLHVI